MTFRPIQDNVLVALEPLATTTASGIVIPGFEYTANGANAHARRDGGKRDFDPRRKRAQLRRARVLAVGPGHHPGCVKCGGSSPNLIPTKLRPGDIVWVDAVAGDDWSLDKSAPRHHTKALNFAQVGDGVGELRVVREEECQLVEVADGDARWDDECPSTVRDRSALPPLSADDYASDPRESLWAERLVPRWPSEDSGVDGAS